MAKYKAPEKKTEKPVAQKPPAKKSLPDFNPHGVISGKTFKSSKEVPLSFHGTFEDCDFDFDVLANGNFYGATFKGCSFKTGFKFVHCNLANTSGVEKQKKEG